MLQFGNAISYLINVLAYASGALMGKAWRKAACDAGSVDAAHRLSPIEVAQMFTGLLEQSNRRSFEANGQSGAVPSGSLQSPSPAAGDKSCSDAVDVCASNSDTSTVLQGSGSSASTSGLPDQAAGGQPSSADTSEPASEVQAELTPTSGLGLSCTLDLRQYYTVRRLGAGGWGWVEQGVLLLPCGSTLHMAVKNLRLRKGAEHLHKVAMRELEGMLALQGCPYGVQLYGTTFDFQTEERGQPLQRFQLFMELAEKGTLKDELDAAVLSNPRGKGNFRNGMLLPETRVAEVAHAVLSALDFMNSNGYAHCDIKLENIFVMEDGGCRLGDPGVACPINASGVLTRGAGTPGCMSAEMRALVNGLPCPYPVTPKADLFGLARVLTLCCMWHDDLMSWEEYLDWRKDLPSCVPAGLKALIASMIAVDPARRPSPREALEHPWLVGAMQQAEKRRWRQGLLEQAAAKAAATAAAAPAAAEATAAGPSPADAWW